MIICLNLFLGGRQKRLKWKTIVIWSFLRHVKNFSGGGIINKNELRNWIRNNSDIKPNKIRIIKQLSAYERKWKGQKSRWNC